MALRNNRGMLDVVEHSSADPNEVPPLDLGRVLDELQQREPIFHHPELGTAREDFDRLTDPDFWETGASGHRYSREQVWSVLEQRYASPEPDHWQTSEFLIREIAPATYLLSYTLLQGPRVTRRATLWQHRATGWTILYHQGTPVAGSKRS